MNSPSIIKILLADDDKDDCNFFQDALEELTIPTTFKALYDGEQLMRYLTEETNEIPTVLFLDLNMPRKNGFACLEEIKQSEKLKQIPVIIFSTSFEESIADLLYKNGAHHYICKPADILQLRKVIEYSLKLITKEKNSQPPRENFLLSNLRVVLL